MKITFLIQLTLMIILSSACTVMPDSTPTPTHTAIPPTLTITPRPTYTPSVIPSNTPTIPVLPTLTITPKPTIPMEGDLYFLEEFEETLSGWSFFLNRGAESKTNTSQKSGKYIFDLQSVNIWAYMIYDKHLYTDVRIDMDFDNRAQNQNHVTIICRYTPGEGWYEFNIGSDGLYRIARYETSTKRYINLANGGSKEIRMGKEQNSFSGICSGEELKLIINGVETKTFRDRTLREGKVGISVSSFEAVPVLVEIERVTISKP